MSHEGSLLLRSRLAVATGLAARQVQDGCRHETWRYASYHRDFLRVPISAYEVPIRGHSCWRRSARMFSVIAADRGRSACHRPAIFAS